MKHQKHIDVEIPKGQLVVLAGVSGSGKSSLAFGTVATEAAREWRILKKGPDKQPGGEIVSNVTGQTWQIEYEGMIPRFRRLYLQCDISKLKKGLRDEIMSFVEHDHCPACGGTGLNPKALALKS